MAGGDGERRRAAFERRDALLQHGAGRVADARVDVAERLQAEQRGGVVDVVEDEGRGLVDRRRARARRRVGLGAGVDRERGEARGVGRSWRLSWSASFVRECGPAPASDQERTSASGHCPAPRAVPTQFCRRRGSNDRCETAPAIASGDAKPYKRPSLGILDFWTAVHHDLEPAASAWRRLGVYDPKLRPEHRRADPAPHLRRARCRLELRNTSTISIWSGI